MERKPPHRPKFMFHTMEIGDEKTVMKEEVTSYHNVNTATRRYSQKHGVRIIALRDGKNYLIKRVK